MMGKKTISIRFCMESREDRELYERLEQEAGTSTSLAAVAKARIRNAYENKDLTKENAGFQDKMINVIREEKQASGMRLVGALISSVRGAGGDVSIDIVENGNELPEKGGELPEGAFEFLR